MIYDKVHQALRGADHEAMMEAIEEEADKVQQRNKGVARGWPARCGYYESILHTLTFELAWARRDKEKKEAPHGVSGSLPLADRLEGKTKEEILQGAKRLCEIYFDIASECIGENEVRRIRDERLGGNDR